VTGLAISRQKFPVAPFWPLRVVLGSPEPGAAPRAPPTTHWVSRSVDQVLNIAHASASAMVLILTARRLPLRQLARPAPVKRGFVCRLSQARSS